MLGEVILQQRQEYVSLDVSIITCGRLCLKCDGTHTETRFCLSVKRASPIKLAGGSVQLTTGSRGVHTSSNNA